MIKKVNITNFKIYKDKTSVPLSKINLLTGTNGKGKSTTLQVFLILAQSVLKNRTSNSIILNGECVNLGDSDDIKNKDTVNHKSTDFSFEYGDFEIKYTLDAPESNSSELQITTVEVITNSDTVFTFTQNKDNKYLYDLSVIPSTENVEDQIFTLYDLFIDSNAIDRYSHEELKSIKSICNLNYVHYISADRIGPKGYYEKKTLGHFVSVGALGEEVANVLYSKSSDTVNNDFFDKCCDFLELDPDATSRTVENFVNIWINEIFDGAGIKIERVPGEEILKLRIKTNETSGFHKPTNVGYGFSYFLPILVAGLIAKPSEILIVENPEAHLHPSAQSTLAKFLALISLSNVQVLIESHSEHILNGLRICVYDQLIKNDDLNVLYFNGDGDDIYKNIDIQIDGGIEDWPDDFFDQSTKDLNYLFGI